MVGKPDGLAVSAASTPELEGTGAWQYKKNFRKSMRRQRLKQPGIHGLLQKMKFEENRKKSKWRYRRWQTREFEVSGYYLRYFKPGGVEPQACIDLRLVQLENGSNLDFALCSRMSQDRMSLRAPNLQEKKRWMLYLQACEADVRTELQLRQKSRATSTRSSCTASSLSGEVSAETTTEVSITSMPEDGPEASRRRSSIASAASSIADKLRDSLRRSRRSSLSFPERSELIVPTLSRRHVRDHIAKLDEPERKLFVVSFNILADSFVTNPRLAGMYTHIDPSCLPWVKRFPMIMSHLQSLEADVFCLQEVEQDVYNYQLWPAMRRMGYLGVLQRKEKRHGKAIPANATFYKSDKLDLVWCDAKFRALVVGLRLTSLGPQSPVIAVANVHLEGAPWKHKQREFQLRSAEKSFVVHESKARIICGDFNSGANSGLCRVKLRSHYESAYGPTNGDATCLLFRHDPSDFDKEATRVDHIFFNAPQLELRCITNVFEADWDRETMIDKGLPLPTWPSDHLSISAVFHISSNTHLGPCPGTALYEAPKEPEVEEHSDIWNDVSERGLERAWSIAPISVQAKEEWTRLQQPPIDLENNKRRKKTPEEIAALKAWSATKKIFMDSLHDDAKEFFAKYQKLKRKVSKVGAC